MEIRRREGEGGGRKGKVENRIIVQRRPRCRLGADEKEEMKWTVRLTGIYILSCAICVSELCRVTVRRIRSGKSVIITRATLAEASPLPSDFAIPSSPHPLLLSPPRSTLASPSPSVNRAHRISSPSSLFRVETLPSFSTPSFFASTSAYLPSLLSLPLPLAGSWPRELWPRAFVPSTPPPPRVCPAAARNAGKNK